MVPSLIYQPGSSWHVQGNRFSQGLVGAYSLASPGVGGRVHNASMGAGAVVGGGGSGTPGVIAQPFHSNGWGNWFGTSLTTSDNVAAGTGTWVDLGDPIATGDDVSVMVGFVPLATTTPTGTGAGNVFNRGADTSGSGWSILMGWQSTNTMQFAVVTTSAGAVQHTATAPGGLNVLQPNYLGGGFKQGFRIYACLNGRPSALVAANSNLRTSGIGSRMGGQSSSQNVGHVDNLLCCFIWRRYVDPTEMALLTTYPWLLWAPGGDEVVVRTGQFSYTASGGIVFGGAGTTSSSRAAIAYSYPASGGIVFGGTSSPALKAKNYITSGGVKLAGTPDLTIAVAQVRFDIVNPSSSPITASFDINPTIGALDSADASFDIYDAANGIDAQFDIFSEALKIARLSDDVQRPVAEVDIHG